ncbi:MAG: phospholipase D-like domain-containing protein [Thermoplasmatota archaeon]
MHPAWVAIAFALLLAPTASGQLLVAVAPDLPGPGAGDEAFAIAATQVAWNTTGHAVTDGETTWPLPDLLLGPGETAWFTGNATAWAAYGGPAAAPWPAGALHLANAGDELFLLGPEGEVLDEVGWGQGRLPTGEALLLRRVQDEGGWRDRGDGLDWATPRLHRVGESELDRPRFTADQVLLYATPDHAFHVWQEVVRSARERLHLHIYELRSSELVDLLEAASPTVDRRILVDASPVGLDLDARHDVTQALERLQDVGWNVTLATAGRYAHHHLKVLVADDQVLVQSENGVRSGVPADPSWGNRGWGAVITSRTMADWFATWMEDDRTAWDAIPFHEAVFDPLYRPPPRLPLPAGDYRPALGPLVLDGPVRVTPVVAPDHTADPARNPILAAIEATKHRVWSQQLQLELHSSNKLGWNATNPLAAAFAVAADGGADVRVQAAAPFHVTDTRSQETMAWLREQGVATRFFGRDDLSILHNKGTLIDDDTVVVGSLNGNHASASRNREVALLVEAPGATALFDELFIEDWRGGPGRDWEAPLRELRAIPALSPLAVVAGAVAALAGRRRVSRA